MKRSFIRRVCNKHFKYLQKQYGNVLGDFEQEPIHDFRLAFKKLRAFLRLLNTCLPENEKLKITNKVKAFYLQTGAVRNLQLLQERITNLCTERRWEVPRVYLSMLQEQEQEQKECCRELSRSVSIKNCQKKVVRRLPVKVKPSCLQQFVETKYQTLLQLLPLCTVDETLHDVRKQLKDLQYNWNYVELYVFFILPPYFTEKANVSALTEKLGDFHDHCVALSFFQATAQMDLPPAEKNILLMLQEHAARNKDLQKQEAIALLTQALALPARESAGSGK